MQRKIVVACMLFLYASLKHSEDFNLRIQIARQNPAHSQIVDMDLLVSGIIKTAVYLIQVTVTYH